MAVYPTLYSDNPGNFEDLMSSNFGGYGVSSFASGSRHGLINDPSIVFTDGAYGESVDILSGSSKVNQSGIQRMLDKHGTYQSNTPFVTDSGKGWIPKNWIPKNLGTGNGLGLSLFDSDGEELILPAWVFLVLALVIVFAAYTAYKIYL